MSIGEEIIKNIKEYRQRNGERRDNINGYLLIQGFQSYIIPVTTLNDIIKRYNGKLEEIENEIKGNVKGSEVQIYLPPSSQLTSDLLLSPGIENFGNTCFHNAVAQFVYRMDTFVDHIIDPSFNIIPSILTVNSVDYANSFIKLLRLMRECAMNPNCNVLTGQMVINYNGNQINLRDLTIISTCKIVRRYTPEKQEDANEMLTNILDIIANKNVYMDNIKNYEDTERKYYKISRDDIYSMMVINRKFECDVRGWEFERAKNLCSRQFDDISKNKIIDEYITSSLIIHIDNVMNYNEFKASVENSARLIEGPVPEEIGYEVRWVKYNVFFNKYLIISLNRFDQNQEKINTRVAIADASNELRIHNNVFKLIGIILHWGRTITEGHYTCLINRDNVWYEYNDTVRTPKGRYWRTSIEYEDRKTPYVMLYEK